MRTLTTPALRNLRPAWLDSVYVLGLCVLLFALWLSPSLNALSAGGLKFQSPTFEEPHYRIQFPFEVRGETILIKDLQLNGAKTVPFKEKEGMPFGLVHVAPEDLSWVGLVNSGGGFGFFSLRLQAAHGNFEVPGEFLHKAGTYFYAPSDGNYVYWVRPLIYTWADYFTNSHFSYVPRGSFFYEKNAYIVMHLGNDLPQRLDMLLKRLRHPLRVF